MSNPMQWGGGKTDSYAVGESGFLAVRLGPKDLRIMIIEKALTPGPIEMGTVFAGGTKTAL